MGQITVDNDHDKKYWKEFFTHVDGQPPVIEAVRDYRITLTSALLEQETLDALVSIYNHDKRRGEPVEVFAPTPSIEEREAAVKMELERNRAVMDERMDKNGFASLP